MNNTDNIKQGNTMTHPKLQTQDTTTKRRIVFNPTRKLPSKLTRRVNDKISEVHVGDVLLTPRGKTFIVTGWDEFSGIIHGQTCCEQKYFLSVEAGTIGCRFVGEGV